MIDPRLTGYYNQQALLGQPAPAQQPASMLGTWDPRSAPAGQTPEAYKDWYQQAYNNGGYKPGEKRPDWANTDSRSGGHGDSFAGGMLKPPEAFGSSFSLMPRSGGRMQFSTADGVQGIGTFGKPDADGGKTFTYTKKDGSTGTYYMSPQENHYRETYDRVSVPQTTRNLNDVGKYTALAGVAYGGATSLAGAGGAGSSGGTAGASGGAAGTGFGATGSGFGGASSFAPGMSVGGGAAGQLAASGGIAGGAGVGIGGSLAGAGGSGWLSQGNIKNYTDLLGASGGSKDQGGSQQIPYVQPLLGNQQQPQQQPQQQFIGLPTQTQMPYIPTRGYNPHQFYGATVWS